MSSAQPQRADDPLVHLPVVQRSQAHLAGSVLVQYGESGAANKRTGSPKARWLRVELEKVEIVPNAQHAAQDNNGPTSRHVELIGVGPGTLWHAPPGHDYDVIPEVSTDHWLAGWLAGGLWLTRCGRARTSSRSRFPRACRRRQKSTRVAQASPIVSSRLSALEARSELERQVSGDLRR